MAIKWLRDEEGREQALALYAVTLANNEPIAAPTLLLFELTNYVRKQMRGQSTLAPFEAEKLLSEFLALPIDFHSPPGMHLLALRMAEAYDLPAASDAHYLALSQLLDCEFWTADIRLYRQTREHRPLVRWIGEFVASR